MSATADCILSVKEIRKSFSGVEVLHGVDFDVRSGEALGLVGENGSGKSTSVNILGGIHRPDAGTMSFEGRPYAPADPRAAIAAGIAFIHQELNLFGNMTIAENIFIDAFPRVSRVVPLIDRGSMRRRASQHLRDVRLDLPPTTPLARLSQGERQLVEIAKALSRQARLIIFDEPTTSLTHPEIVRLFAIIAALKAKGIGVIYISHVLDDVLAVCERVTVLRDGAVVGTGPARDMRISKLISLMVGRPIDSVYPERATAPRRDPALRVSGLSQPGVAENVSFEVRAGEVVGLAGLMGSGRSELARMIFGIDPFQRGSIEVGGVALTDPTPIRAIATGLAFLTEDRRGEGLLMEIAIAENTILASLRAVANRIGLIDQGRVREAAGILSRRVHLSTERVAETQVKHLSGGNQQKVVIAKWLMRAPRVFILDEPTRGIDVGAKQEVYRIINALVEAGSAVLLISSEIEELIGLADRILTIRRGELTGSFDRVNFDREAIMAAAAGGGPGDPERGMQA